MAKANNATDIVPVAVLDKIADRIRKKAAEIARRKRAPLGSERTTKNKYDPRLIHKAAPKITKNQIQINLSLSEVGAAFEWGSKPHPIRAKNKPLLKFWGTHGHDYLVTTESVDHPGFAAKPFLEPAKKETRQENMEDIKNAATQNIRLIVKGMSRKI